MPTDITDDEGRVLLSHVFRLESLTAEINQAFEECGIDQRLTGAEAVVNRSRARAVYQPTPRQVRRVQELYADDFEVYENALGP